jgi:tetratricopeptide (TPR) repeat protein
VLKSDQCTLRYHITTESAECQGYFDQGLGYLYSYVWMEAARSFETATQRDPNCPMAHWGLARAMARWNRDSTGPLKKAWELRERASQREQMLIKAMMEEKGLLPGVGGPEERKKKATATIDDMIATYDDDQEAWFYRAQLGGGGNLFGGTSASVPFYKALLRINPDHPGANHELVHFYEQFQRPALGWPYAEGYIRSSPGIPHAFHMQAHLATRLGRWQKTSDRSAQAIKLEREYHRRENVKPAQDHQYSHQLETLFVSLVHDGRFTEARAIQKECEACRYDRPEVFFRLHLAARDYDAALAIARKMQGAPSGGRGKGRRPARRGDKATASYLVALVYLAKGEPARALPEIDVMREASRTRRGDQKLTERLQVVQGLYLCQTGDGAAGLKMLKKAVDKTKNDYGHHAWGNGASLMEWWGIGALAANDLAAAEEAFQEALAHDPGSVRGALGMQVVCEKQGRSEEIERFARLARRCWSRADAGHIDAELAAMRGEKGVRVDPTKKGK